MVLNLFNITDKKLEKQIFQPGSFFPFYFGKKHKKIKQRPKISSSLIGKVYSGCEDLFCLGLHQLCASFSGSKRKEIFINLFKPITYLNLRL